MGGNRDMKKTQAIRRYEGIKAYSKYEMAGFYNISVSTFLEWIDRPTVMDPLVAAGYIRTQKILKPIQVKIIVQHLGEP
jgi:hypothetical protein